VNKLTDRKAVRNTDVLNSAAVFTTPPEKSQSTEYIVDEQEEGNQETTSRKHRDNVHVKKRVSKFRAPSFHRGNVHLLPTEQEERYMH